MAGYVVRLIVGVVAASVVVVGTVADARDLLIQNARLIDGRGGPPRPGISILIRESRIAEIGANAVAESGAAIIDATGASVLPGLIDAHVHMSWGPGTALQAPSEPDTWSALYPHYLRSYLACGITTVLDAAVVPRVAREIQAWFTAGNPGPRYLTLGPFLRPPGGYPRGYPDEFWLTLSSEDDVRDAVDLTSSLGAVGVKLPIERGWNPFWSLPPHSSAVLAALREAAAERRLPIYVHATSEEDQATALALGARALVHPIQYRPSPLSDEFVRRMAESGVYQMTTFSVMDSQLALYHRERLVDPLLTLVVPPAELAFARDTRNGRAALRSMVRDEAPSMPDFLRDIAARFWLGEGAQREALRRSQEAVRRLHGAGVPIVVGSDTPFRASALYAFHGPTTLREIELLAEAGLPPSEVIRAATRTPAEMLGLGNEIGTIEAGKRADLVIVAGDPLQDLRSLRRILWTVRDGVARSPEEWMGNRSGSGSAVK